MNIPKATISQQEIKKLKQTEILEVVSMKITDLIITQGEDTVVVFEADGQKFAAKINEHDSGMLTFVDSGCSDFSHIKTIYQLFTGYLKNQGTKLTNVTLEAKEGDIHYVRLEWTDVKHRRFYNLCSLGDALILAFYEDTELNICKNVIPKMDSYDEEWPSDEEIINYD